MNKRFCVSRCGTTTSRTFRTITISYLERSQCQDMWSLVFDIKHFSKNRIGQLITLRETTESTVYFDLNSKMFWVSLPSSHVVCLRKWQKTPFYDHHSMFLVPFVPFLCSCVPFVPCYQFLCVGLYLHSFIGSSCRIVGLIYSRFPLECLQIFQGIYRYPTRYRSNIVCHDSP